MTSGRRPTDGDRLDQFWSSSPRASVTSGSQLTTAAARLTSPLAGTVADVGLQPSQAVGASSTTSAVTVLGGGQQQVVASVALTDIDSVKVGDAASMAVDGRTTPFTEP
jgi:trimeric autotransporter adhesin